MRRLLKWGLLAAGVGYALGVRELEPTAKDLLSPEWHAEAPMRLMMSRLADLLP